ncbi:SagB/ThcOx family dehydrogenase [Nonomuraea candida]|uniref:SagB/ThcOx family dehydrogenase n=1 Tax=Nonomuraea candida TaxID=359159 RepID=UPI000A6F471F|nr:SagB/ThcOx family dehydrogenase [Nonomuraea candida]
MRLRRRRCLVCYWHDGTFVARPYPGGEAVTLPATAAALLAAYEDWTAPPQEDADDGTITLLREHGILLAEGGEEAERDARAAEEWGSWEAEDPFFPRTATAFPETAAVFPDTVTAFPDTVTAFPDTVTAFPDTATAQTQRRARSPGAGEGPAPFAGRPHAARILLPRRPAELATPFGEVLRLGAARGDLASGPVALTTLAALLATCFGPAGHPGAPSCHAGARQELDPYLAVWNVSGVPAGVYRYDARDHSLALLGEGFTGAEAVHLCAGQEWAGQAAFLVVLAAVVERARARHRLARAHRVCLLDAGHLGQLFALTAAALGLGPRQTGAFHDGAVAGRLGLDGSGHTPLSVLGAGHPRTAAATAGRAAGPPGTRAAAAPEGS